MFDTIEELNVKDVISNLCEGYVNEVMSIADEVKDVCDKVISEILYGIKNNSSEPINYDELTFKKGSVFKTFLDKNIVVEWRYYNFWYEESYKRHINKIRRNNKTKQNGLSVTLVIEAISGNIDKYTLYASLHHEMNHLYQYIKRGERDLLPTKNDEDKYKTYIGLMNSANPRDRMVGEIMYMSFNFELDGKINGLYGELMSADNIDNMWKVLKNSDVYAFLKDLKHYSKLLSAETDNQRFKDNLKQDYGIKIKDLLNTVITIQLNCH